MRRHSLFLCLFAALSLVVGSLRTAAAENIMGIDFSKSVKEVHNTIKGSFDGVLPQEGTADYQGWTESVATSRLVTEEGRSFLRINVTKLDKSVQFNFPLKKVKLPGRFKLTIEYRARDSDLGLSFRQLPPPWETLWSTSTSSSAEAWREKSFFIDIQRASDVPVGLFLYLGNGETDLASVAIDTIGAAEYAAAVSRPGKDVVNFFRNSRFPLGLQSGWNLDGNSLPSSAMTDTSVIGPSGSPALKLSSDAGMTLYSEPFQTADPAAKNYVSFACQGGGSWKISVASPDDALASIDVKPSQEWRTETIEFHLDEKATLAPALQVKFTGSGVMRIDSLRAWAGPGGRPYQSQGECEVALGLPDSELSVSRIQFSDEPATFVYCVSGAFEGDVLKVTVVNAFAESRPLPDIALPPKMKPPIDARPKPRPFFGDVDFGVFKDAPYGQFRIEAWVERGGRRVSPHNEILVSRIRRPYHWNEDAQDSPFGAHVRAKDCAIKMMKAAGVNWARLHDAATGLTGWSNLEQEKGKWTFHDVDVQRYRSAKMKIYAGLQTAPRWASVFGDSGMREFHSYFGCYFQPKNIDDWRTYVKTVVSHYKGVIDEYHIWNEPWGVSFWHTGYDQTKKEYLQGATPADDYAKLSVAAYTAAKEADPQVRLAGFNTTSAQWTKSVFDAGAYDYCDVVDYHFYTPNDQGMPGDQAALTYADAIGYIKGKAPLFAKPVYMSEGQGNANGLGGVGTVVGLYKHSIPWMPEDAPLLRADKTCRYVIANMAAGCAKVFLYSAHGYTSLLRGSGFFALIGPDGYPHLELSAYSNMAWQLEGSTFLRTLKLTDAVCAFVFKGRNGSVAVISGKRSGAYTVPGNHKLDVCDLFGNPLKGNVQFNGLLLYITSPLQPQELCEALLVK